MPTKSQNGHLWGQNVNVVIILTGEKRKKVMSAHTHFCWDVVIRHMMLISMWNVAAIILYII